MSYSDYNKGAEHAYYGFGCYHGGSDYRRGYYDTLNRMEEEEMERQCKLHYEKEMENQYYAEMAEEEMRYYAELEKHQDFDYE